MSTSTLRPIVQRLSSVQVEELPRIASFLASSLIHCAPVLSSPSSQTAAAGGEDAVLLQKLKTRISSLLQDRTPRGRWTGVILAKAVIEAGGWEILKGCESWARGFQSILNRPDPISTKRLSIIALTRVFTLTRPYPTLIREITTPLLPSFLTSCLNIITTIGVATPEKVKQARSLLGTVLEAFNLLLPHHPTIFRPFASKIHQLLLKVVSEQTTTAGVRQTAQDLFVALHYCAARNSAGMEWEAACKSLIASIHGTLDQIFRSVLEDWDSSDGQRRQQSVTHRYDEVVGSVLEDPSGFPDWKNLREGAGRVAIQLQLLSSFLRQGTAIAVSFPVGSLLDLSSRIASVLVPKPGRDKDGIRHNPEVRRDERDELFLEMPVIHCLTLGVLKDAIQCLNAASLPICAAILEQASWVFDAESDHETLRAKTYELISMLLPLIGPSIDKADMRTLAPIFKACAKDLLPLEMHESRLADGRNKNGKPNGVPSTNADSFLKGSEQTTVTNSSHTPSSNIPAWHLLPAIYQKVPSNRIPHALRVDLDRTSILTNHKEALLASTLYPPPATKGKPAPPSLLPFLARSNDDELALEGLLRPRMPPIMVDNTSTEDADIALQDGKNDMMENEYPAPWDVKRNSSPAQLGTSLLDQLEDSLPNASPNGSRDLDSIPNAKKTTQTPFSNMPPESENPPHAFQSQKRDLNQMATPTPGLEDSVTHSNSDPAPHTKRLRPDASFTETSQTHSAQPTTAIPPMDRSPQPSPTNPPTQFAPLQSSSSSQTPNIITENITVAPTISETTIPTDEKGKGVDRGEQANTENADEDDDSDFEIPPINLESDTDEDADEDGSNDEQMGD